MSMIGMQQLGEAAGQQLVQNSSRVAPDLRPVYEGAVDSDRGPTSSHEAVIDSKQIEEARKFWKGLEGVTSQLWQKEAGSAELQDMMMFAILGTMSGFIGDKIMRVMNTTNIVNQEAFLTYRRRKNRDGRGLITAMNHIHWLDDPLLHIALYGDEYINVGKGIYGDGEEYSDWKWTPADGKNFFSHSNAVLNSMFRDFFGRTKTLPVLRGKGEGRGLNQKSLTCLADSIGVGDWGSIFGEGTRSPDADKLNPFKPGIGFLVKKKPQTMILPVAHDGGLKDISPMGVKGEVYAKVKYHNGEPLDVMDCTTKERKRVVLSNEAEMRAMINSISNKNMRVKKSKNDILRTGKTVNIVVGDPFTMEDIANEVPDNLQGYLMIAEEIRARLLPYFLQARELGKNS